MSAEGEQKAKGGLAKEEANEGTFALFEFVFDDVVHTRLMWAQRFETVGVFPVSQRALSLHIDETVQLYVLVECVPFNTEWPEVEPELCDHSVRNDASFQCVDAERRRREQWERGGGTVKVPDYLNRCVDVEVGGEVLDTQVMGPGRSAAKCARVLPIGQRAQALGVGGTRQRIRVRRRFRRL